MPSIIDAIFHHGLLWHEFEHALFAFPFAFILYHKIKSKRKAFTQILILFLVAYFLDLDHLFDYFLYYGFHFSITDFYKMKYFVPHGISYVPLHGWEWTLILGYFAYKGGWKSIFTPIVFGMLSHLVLDAFNVESFIFYSVVYRYFQILVQ